MSTLFESSGDPVIDRRLQYACDLAARGEAQAAIDLLDQTLADNPAFTSAWFALGEMLAQAGEAARAAQAFQKVMAQDAQDRRGARLHLARIEAASVAQATDGVPPEMPPDYVRTLFDQYAPRFDEALTVHLAYRAPQLLRDALVQVCAQASKPAHFARVMDLGCGTGLGVRALQGMIIEAVGVDLSAGMVAQAQMSGLYAALHVGGMVEALQAEADASFDLVLIADAVMYVADLAPLINEAARVLMPRGMLAFSAETHDGEGVILGEKLRYAHAPQYLSDVIARAGLHMLHMAQASSRNDGGVPVPGLVVVAMKA